MNDPVRIALVGAGRMGSVHLRALQSAESIELAGVVEPAAPIRDRLAAAGVGPLHASPDELGSVDGVLIAVPSDRHVEVVAHFASRGVSVLCEKPLGVSAADAADAADAAAGAGIVLQVGYWRRFVPELRALRERIASGSLGEIYQLSCMQWDAEPPTAEFAAASGGIAIDMGVHELDQIRWLTGQEIVGLDAVAAGPPAPPDDPECAVVLVRLSGGAAAVVSLGRRFPYADSCWLELWATAGYERVPFMWDGDVWSEAGAAVFDAAMLAQVEAFARAIGGAPPEGAGGGDAVAALAAAESATQSLAHASV